MFRLTSIAALLLIPSSLIQAHRVDEILSRYVKAMGGVEKVKTIQTIRIVQRVDDGGPPNAAFVIIRKRGNQFRLEQSLGVRGLEVREIQGCDGRTSWSKVGDSPAKPATGNSLCDGVANIDDFLIGYKQGGHTAELIGKEKLMGKDVYHLRLTDPKNIKDVMDCFLDAQSFLPVKTTYQSGPDHHEDIFTDYRKIDGIMVAFTTEQRWWPVGKEPAQKRVQLESTPDEGHQKQIVETIEFNLPFADSLFLMPQDNDKASTSRRIVK
jgi:hypothetical protein